jgi:hypothetical protein
MTALSLTFSWLCMAVWIRMAAVDPEVRVPPDAGERQRVWTAIDFEC